MVPDRPSFDNWATRKGAVRMSDLVVIAFETETKAEEVRQKLFAMQKEYLIASSSTN
jgi:hypothetical protein